MHDLPRHFKVVRTDRELEMPRVDARLLEAGGHLVVLVHGTPEDELAREVADADLLLMCYARDWSTRHRRGPKLKAIVKYGVGIDAIDIDAAREYGIPVVNVPAYAEETVAEGAFALLMALFKRFKPIHQAMQCDGWAWPELALAGQRPVGQDAGTGGARAHRWQHGAHGRRVSHAGGGPRPAPAPAAGRHPACSAATSSIALEASDAVSVHCVLNAQTRHLLGAAQLALHEAHGLPGERVARRDRRRGGAAAGPEGAAHRRRRARRLRPRAAVTPGSPVVGTLRMDNVMLWPHLTFYTHEAMQRLEDETLARCFEALRGQPRQRGLARPAPACADPGCALRRWQALNPIRGIFCILLTISNTTI